MDTATDITIRISLPPSILDKYEHRAKQLGRSMEQEIESRLRLVQDIDSTKPMILSDGERQKLERLLGRNFNDAPSLVASMTRAISLEVGEFLIPLSLHLLERLHSRCIGIPFEKFITQLITRQLEEFVGMR